MTRGKMQPNADIFGKYKFQFIALLRRSRLGSPYGRGKGATAPVQQNDKSQFVS